MLLQTNSYVVPRDRRMEHARILRRFRQTLLRLGCDHFEVYEQVGANWSGGETSGRFVQIMRFRDRKHQIAVQQAERADPAAQNLLREFCELINLPYQQQQGLFAVGYYTSFLRMPSPQMQAGQGMLQSTTEEQLQADEHAESEESASEQEAGQADAAVESAESSHGGEQSRFEGYEPAEEEAAGETSPAEATAEARIEAATAAESEHELPGPLEDSPEVPEMEIPAEQTVPDGEALTDSERMAHEAAAPVDTNEDEANVEARNEMPIEADGLDSDSVFLGSADGDLDEPGAIRPLPVDDDAEADTEKPASPFNT